MEQDNLQFCIDIWYPKFKQCTYKTKIIPIPSEFIIKIRNDVPILAKDLPEDFIQKIDNALKYFNNLAFIKNNWHAPTDAKYFSLNNLLQACNVNDVLTYLSTSHILSMDFENSEHNNFCIAVRPWKYIHPASEFRCIVLNNILRGITPRNWPVLYSHYKEEAQTIIDIVKGFFEKNIKLHFNHCNYTFDIILNIPDDIILLDFGPINRNIDFYAFKWKEINKILTANESNHQHEPIFRYLQTSKTFDSKINALLLTEN